jgi:Nuclease-related domain
MGEKAAADPGGAGTSARREARRLRERREELASTRTGVARMIALLIPQAEDKRLLAEEKAWATGARGEETVSEALARRCPQVRVLHDRRMPRSRANIDHLAIAPSGVYVIDTKHYRGKVDVRKPLFGSERLMIAGSDRTNLVKSLAKQVETAREAVQHLAPRTPVYGCFGFVNPAGLLQESGLPRLRTLTVGGYPLLYPRKLASRLSRRGPLTPDQARVLAAELDRLFPPR